ncbi:6-phosphogluconolactonase [Kordiimonas pumila]|uniref:6-phosphogluconolactonase n=1 Tax=Kordiimonas pumila TaxID=2161677 RepID=A0ABV7D749_9PROT|nr:6-phosphogluconolactonase [Kordiimonas pumila]
MTKWHIFDSRKEMVQALKTATTEALIEGMLKKGRASWAVSGGTTPTPFFEAMRDVQLDWARVQIALVDERWVNPGHARSNETSVKSVLCKNMSAKARFIGMKTPHETPQEAEVFVNERYGTIELPFDSILLGMGPDAHTASFFPGAEGLGRALDPSCGKVCVALHALKSDVTGDELNRMSLSAAAIIAAKNVALMITGREKKKVLDEALQGARSTPVGRLAQLKPFDIYWAP